MGMLIGVALGVVCSAVVVFVIAYRFAKDYWNCF